MPGVQGALSVDDAILLKPRMHLSSKAGRVALLRLQRIKGAHLSHRPLSIHSAQRPSHLAMGSSHSEFGRYSVRCDILKKTQSSGWNGKECLESDVRVREQESARVEACQEDALPALDLLSLDQSIHQWQGYARKWQVMGLPL